MKITQINNVHIVLPKTVEEKYIMDKTLMVCSNDGMYYTDAGNESKWNDFLYFYDKKMGRSLRPSQRE